MFNRKTKEQLEEESKHHENVMQQTPMADGTNENDEVLGGNVLQMDHIKDYKHKQIFRDLNDFFDYRREKVPEEIGIGIFPDKKCKVFQVVTNTFNEGINNSLYIESNSFMYDPIPISFIACDDSRYNEKIGLLTDKAVLGMHQWDGPIGAETKIGLRLQKPDIISGITIAFPDATKQKYIIGIQMVNEDAEVVSEVMGVEISQFSNMQQVIAFKNPIPDIDKVLIHLKIDTQEEDYQTHVFHIDVLRDVNRELLKSMSKANIFPFQLIENPVFVKKDKTNIDQKVTK